MTLRLLRENLAIGVEWTLHESKALARRSLSGRRHLKVVGKSVDGEYLQGVVEQPGWRSTVQSAAWLLAETGETIIVYHRLDDGLVWMCGVSNGSPNAGYDQVVTPAEADKLFTDLTSTWTKPMIIGDEPGAIMPLNVFLDRPGLLNAKSAVMENPHAKLIKSGLFLVGVAAVFVLYFIGDVAVKAAAARTAENQAIIIQAQQKKAEEQHRKALQAAVDEARSKIFEQPDMLQQYGIWHDFLRQVPLSVNGWRPQSVNCVPAECQVSWKKELKALPSDVKNLPGRLGAQSETEATTSFELPQASPRLDPPTPGDITTYLVDMAATSLQVAFRVLPPSQDIIPQLPPPFTGQSTTAIGREGTFEVVNGSPVVLAIFLPKIAKPGVLLRAMKVPTFNGGKSSSPITLEGAYRVVL